MNIFYIDTCPVKAAQMQCDKHVVKMVLESAQMLCTAHHSFWQHDVPYKPTHRNHPSAVWARSNSKHYDWLFWCTTPQGNKTDTMHIITMACEVAEHLTKQSGA